MTITVAIAIIAGLLAVLTSAWLNQPWFSSNIKRAVAGVVTAIFAIISAIVQGYVVGFPPEWQEILVNGVLWVAGLIVVAQGLYSQFKPVLQLLTDKLPSPVPVPAEVVTPGERYVDPPEQKALPPLQEG